MLAMPVATLMAAATTCASAFTVATLVRRRVPAELTSAFAAIAALGNLTHKVAQTGSSNDICN